MKPTKAECGLVAMQIRNGSDPEKGRSMSVSTLIEKARSEYISAADGDEMDKANWSINYGIELIEALTIAVEALEDICMVEVSKHAIHQHCKRALERIEALGRQERTIDD